MKYDGVVEKKLVKMKNGESGKSKIDAASHNTLTCFLK
jgi:hypothetical protein